MKQIETMRGKSVAAAQEATVQWWGWTDVRFEVVMGMRFVHGGGIALNTCSLAVAFTATSTHATTAQP